MSGYAARTNPDYFRLPEQVPGIQLHARCYPELSFRSVDIARAGCFMDLAQSLFSLASR